MEVQSNKSPIPELYGDCLSTVSKTIKSCTAVGGCRFAAQLKALFTFTCVGPMVHFWMISAQSHIRATAARGPMFIKAHPTPNKKYVSIYGQVFCVGALLIVEGKGPEWTGYMLTTFCFVWCCAGFQTHSDLISAVRLSVSCGTSDRTPNFGQKVVICSSCTEHRQQIGNQT